MDAVENEGDLRSDDKRGVHTILNFGFPKVVETYICDSVL